MYSNIDPTGFGDLAIPMMISYVTFLMPQKTMAYKLVMKKVDSPYLHIVDG
jgi:hypothetical protein